MKDCMEGKNNISVVGSGFELGPSHARRITKRPNTLTHWANSDNCEAKRCGIVYSMRVETSAWKALVNTVFKTITCSYLHSFCTKGAFSLLGGRLIWLIGIFPQSVDATPVPAFGPRNPGITTSNKILKKSTRRPKIYPAADDENQVIFGSLQHIHIVMKTHIYPQRFPIQMH
jgi:hypothetical protein